jgi:murein L,D-transpeptidase YcbB/YkuD
VSALAVVVCAAACSGVDRQQNADAVRRLSAKAPRWVERTKSGQALWSVEQKFYEQRGYQPAWIDGDDPTPQLDALLRALRDAELHGLDSARYGLNQLVAERQKADEAVMGASFEPERVPDLDLRLTYAFLQHASDIIGSPTAAREVDRNWLATPKNEDLLAHLTRALDGNQVREALDGLAPAHPQYKGLQAALARYRKEGDRAVAGTSGDPGDDLPVSWRLQQIRMNLERWRWLPRDLGEHHILINVPAYQMQVIEGEKPVLAMRVIVGKPDTRTPLFSDYMTYVVFSPYWNIPETILREETVPKLVKDPDYLVRNNIEVVRGAGKAEEVIDASSIDWSDKSQVEGVRFRQAPGPENALGLVKFIFPNHFNVYLHDTPGDTLFNRERRTLSHGCIRIEKPADLAEYVLADQSQWTPERIRTAMNAQQEQSVTLKKPLPVHIGYWTAWVEADGQVKFTEDPYGLDRAQARLMTPAAVPTATRAE